MGKGPLFVKEMLAFYEDPKPHFNTLSTIVRGLEEKGFLAHYTFGNTYQYYPVVSEEDFRKGTLRNVISKYFNNSYLNAVSSLVKEEDISLDELKQLIEEVEQADKNTNLLNENLCYGSFLHLYIKIICLSCSVLPVFRLLLSKETFHRFNRMALLGVLFFSLLIPCIEVTTRHQVEVQQAVLSIEQLLLMAELEATPANVGAVQETPTISWVQIVLLVYLAGILFLVCRNIYSLICLFRLVHSGKHEKLEKGVTLVVHNQEIAPFSWMKYIVISRKDLEENGREILIHEMAHIHHRHLVDLLVADICIFSNGSILVHGC